jgi:hypothetical protein
MNCRLLSVYQSIQIVTVNQYAPHFFAFPTAGGEGNGENDFLFNVKAHRFRGDAEILSGFF